MQYRLVLISGMHKKQIEKNFRGQIAPLSTILVLAIVLILVVATYMWGTGILSAQQTRTNINYMQARLLDIRSNIIEVSQEGLNSTRIINVHVPEGILAIQNGRDPCGSFPNDPTATADSNSISYNLSYKDKLIDATSWIIIDPRESSQDCVTMNNNSAAVLLGKSAQVASMYDNTFLLWFRALSDSFGNKYLINLSRGSASSVSGGVHTISVKNTGTVNVSVGGVWVIYTNIKVDIV